MAEIPQYENEDPILQTVPVKSTAEGYEAFGNVLSQVSGAAEKETEQLATDQSQTMYINSVANAEHLKSQYEMQIIQNPDKAFSIANNLKQSLNILKQSATVNDQDRTKLNAYLQNSYDDIEIKATTAQVKQSQLQSAFVHYENWPLQLNALQSTLLKGDINQAHQLEQGMLGSLKGLLITGAITPKMLDSSIKQIYAIHDVIPRFQELYGNNNATAKDYHTANYNILDTNSTHLAQSPIDGNTKWLIDQNIQNSSMQGMKADLDQGILPNQEAFLKATTAHQNEILEYYRGAQEAHGLIRSGPGFPVLSSELQNLDDKAGFLTPRQQSKRNVLKLFVNGMKNGNWQETIGNFPEGARIMQNYTDSNSAIDSIFQQRLDSAQSDAQKQEIQQQWTIQRLKNKNKFVDDNISIADGLHMPSKYVQPIHDQDVSIAQSGFSFGQDPNVTLQKLNEFTPKNQIFLAGAMKDPDQQMILQGASYSANNLKYQDKVDMILANQKGRSYNDLVPDSSSRKDPALKKKIESELGDQLRLLRFNLPTENVQTLQDSMIDTTLNLVKFYAQKNQDFTLSNSKKYIDQAVSFYKTSHPVISNTNYFLNQASLPEDLTKSQLDALALYATDTAYDSLSLPLQEKLQPQVTGKSFSVQGSNQRAKELLNIFRARRNPLRMVITNDHKILAVDENGEVYFSHLYSGNLMKLAEQYANKKQKSKEHAIFRSEENIARTELHLPPLPTENIQ